MYFSFDILSSRHPCKNYEETHVGKINIPGINAKFNVYKQNINGESRNHVTKVGTGCTAFSNQVYTRMLTHKYPYMCDTCSDKVGVIRTN